MTNMVHTELCAPVPMTKRVVRNILQKYQEFTVTKQASKNPAILCAVQEREQARI